MDQPTTLTQLVEALTALPDLDPVERARRCPLLIEASRSLLAEARVAAMREATDRSRDGAVTQVALAKALGVSRTVVTDAVRGGRTRPR